jgi:ElaB/YqjD/DUF883 family membrane-anchored ribosome-binding protein
MAELTNGSTKKAATRRKRTAKGGAAKRAGARRTTARRSVDVGELQRIIMGLEERINQLTSHNNIRQTVTGATNQMGDVVTDVINRTSAHVGEYVADKVSNVADRIRGGATSVTGAAKSGTGAMQRIGAEIERRPMMTVAIALGIGFLAGLVGRRDNAA